MKSVNREYSIGAGVRISRLVIGILSLVVILVAQFYVVGGVTGDYAITQWKPDEDFFRASPVDHMDFKVIMVVLLVTGLALVTLGFEILLDRSPGKGMITHGRKPNDGRYRYGRKENIRHAGVRPNFKRLTVHNS